MAALTAETSAQIEACARPASYSTRALILLAGLAVIAFLYLAREVLVPVALALLGFVVLSSAVEAGRRRGIPRALCALLLLALGLAGIGALVNVAYGPAQEWFARVPHTVKLAERRLRPAEQLLQQLNSLVKPVAHLNASSPPPPDVGTAPGSGVAPAVSGAQVLTVTRTMLVNLIGFVILTMFLLSGGPPMLARMAAACSSDLRAGKALAVIEAIRAELGRYYGTLAFINLGLALATGLVLMSLKVPSPFLWGAAAGVLNFVPYVGPGVMLILLSGVGLLTFNDPLHALGVPGAFLVLTTIEGQCVQPLLVGRRLDLNPIVVFLAVWFGAALWGIAGIVVAVPVLVAIKVAAAHGNRSAPVVEFLSPGDSASVLALPSRASALASRMRRPH